MIVVVESTTIVFLKQDLQPWCWSELIAVVRFLGGPVASFDDCIKYKGRRRKLAEHRFYWFFRKKNKYMTRVSIEIVGFI
jgi:hypothetical protein